MATKNAKINPNVGAGFRKPNKFQTVNNQEDTPMPIEVIDMVDFAHQEKKRKEIFNTPRFHAWMHYYKPGHKDDMHCHNADQTFYVIDGECTMRFPDGGTAVLKPGMAATITGGSFYQLENCNDKPMIMMGNRSGPSENIQIIDYVTRKDTRQKVQADLNAG
ncbi:MAG: cupin domain-containing protein [Deltaproteobacteria bacterium]|nr:cupin domain-containing protein [Deltaproteobacteria bacterium]